MPMAPTPIQSRVLRFLRDHLVRHGYPPSVREIQQAFGFASPRSAAKHLRALESQGLIDPHPSHVESNSINAFDPTPHADLTAFGFHVFAIVGYQKGDPMFRKGDGKPLADSAYGAVVLGSTDSVKTAVRAGGSSAIVHHVAPFVTAIFCQTDAGKPAD